ncbi:GNAT family N-acetyltransferase [Parasporobacterium paucivorans]|uniref:Ribosomal-protein-alanine N-acetyltransferase n=2 Tax=Parasporobacterium TaxID=115543 RepID=A0A1M6CWZ2_9FIRM|nr:GNAT family N-acetyltransferase [Parasporobacterium paucivorans]SHI65403.1 ribosomal-protein-alanine N-acetyltransferase [Parasporobacterium paucivorans DSM 15970]
MEVEKSQIIETNTFGENAMDHKGTKNIETERLILRPFIKEDADLAYKNWTSDDAVTKFLRWPAHKDISVTKRVLDDWIYGYESLDFYQWAIVLKSIGEPIGTISVVDKNERLDIVHIGYCIGSKWWQQGITSEAFGTVIPFFFDEIKVNRIESQHDPDNPASGRVMKKCGLKYEGTMRQADFNNHGIVDACMHSLLRDEYISRF